MVRSEYWLILQCWEKKNSTGFCQPIYPPWTPLHSDLKVPWLFHRELHVVANSLHSWTMVLFFFKQEREVIGACALAPEITLILIDRNRALLTDAYIILCFNKAWNRKKGNVNPSRKGKVRRTRIYCFWLPLSQMSPTWQHERLHWVKKKSKNSALNLYHRGRAVRTKIKKIKKAWLFQWTFRAHQPDTTLSDVHFSSPVDNRLNF